MRRTAYETISIGEIPEVRPIRARRCDSVDRRGDESLELVNAVPVWVGRDHVLASPGGIGVKPDPVGSLRPARPDALAASDDGALGPDDTRGAREVHGRHGETLRPIRVDNAWAGRGITCHGTVMSGARASPRLLEALRQE